MSDTKILTTPLDIRYAFEKNDGWGAIALFAKKHGYSGPYISQVIHQVRPARHVLQLMADHLGCAVYDVEPGTKNTPSPDANQGVTVGADTSIVSGEGVHVQENLSEQS